MKRSSEDRAKHTLLPVLFDFSDAVYCRILYFRGCGLSQCRSKNEDHGVLYLVLTYNSYLNRSLQKKILDRKKVLNELVWTSILQVLGCWPKTKVVLLDKGPACLRSAPPLDLESAVHEQYFPLWGLIKHQDDRTMGKIHTLSSR